MRFLPFAAVLAAALLAAPATAQRAAPSYPLASTLAGSERILASQGSGCPSAPCAVVNITVTQLSSYIGSGFQLKDADLDAIAALTTQSFGRSLLTQADASAARGALGLGSIATQAGSGVAITGGSVTGITDLSVADGGTGASTAQAAAANLSIGWVIAKSGVAVSATGSTADVVLASVTIPAGAVGPNGQVEVFTLTNGTASANAKNVKVRLGGTVFQQIDLVNTPVAQTYTRIANRNSASSQVSFNGGRSFQQAAATQITTASVNTAAATTLEITGQVATTSETVTLESYLVRITYGA